MLNTGTVKGQDHNMINAINDQFACYIKDNNNGEVLRNIASFFLSTGEFNQVISYAEQLRNLGESNNNMRYRAYANAYLGQAYLMTNQVDAAKSYLNQALKQATSIQNDSILCSVYNGLGLYASNVDADYNGSIELFFKGVEASKRCAFTRLYNILLCNISGVYYLKGDANGLKYAQECYNYGHLKNDPFLALWGAINSSKMYFLMGEYEEALKYIKESEFLLQKNKYKDQADVYTTYGDILLALEDEKGADNYYKEALSNIGSATSSSTAYVYLSYGKRLLSKGKYSEAVILLDKGLKVCIEAHNRIFIKEFYDALSKCYEKMGVYNKSLEYYKIYHQEVSHAFNEESERSMNKMRVQFDTQKKENEAEQARLELINKNRKMQSLLIILSLAVLTSIYIYILYVRKNRLYRQIIIRNREAIKREDELKEQISNFKKDCPAISERYSASSLKGDKIEDMFLQIQHIMREEHLYHDPALTKEKIAEILGTNRTYLSQVINDRSGLTVPQYINTFRIDEAVRILSDTKDDTPLKAIAIDLGFNSISTFYKLFQTSVGMTPSLYRKKAREFSS